MAHKISKSCEHCGRNIRANNLEKHINSHNRIQEKKILSKRIAWNKGLTKETSLAVAKISDTQRGRLGYSYPHTIESKKKISDALKLAHKEGRNLGWTVRNKDPDRRTYPERWFIKAISNDEVLSKLIIAEQFRVGKYFLDFAFLEYSIDLEIDGKQHFENLKIIESDKLRNNFMIENGWKVYRIKWTALYEDPKKVINDFKEYINKIEKQPYTIISCQKIKPIKQDKYEKNIQKQSEADTKLQLLKNSNIDFTKYGWVQKSAQILQIKTQKISNWMKKFHLEFYKSCYIRK